LYSAFKNFYGGNSKNINQRVFKSILESKGIKPSIMRGYVIFRNIEFVGKDPDPADINMDDDNLD